jgi:crossover junction endodeoxyribonuclease RuvC
VTAPRAGCDAARDNTGWRMRVLGIDPGTVATGWGVVDAGHSRLRRVASGVIRTRGVLPVRLARIYDETCRVLDDYEPAWLSLEKPFVGANVQSAFRLGEARGAILAAAARAGVRVHEYSPAEIKVAVAGTGRAVKEQVTIMVQRLLAIDGGLAEDEADALGAAICHVHTRHDAAHVPGLMRRRPRAATRAAWARLVATRRG